MFRILALMVGAFSLFAGVGALLLLRFLPPQSALWWVLPPALIAAALWLLRRCWGWRVAAVALAAATLAAWSVTARFWPASSFLSTSRQVAGVSSTNSPAISQGLRKVSLETPVRFRQGPLASPRALFAPEGVRVSVFAAGLGSPRLLAVGPQGHLFVSVPGEGKVLALPDADRDGVADRIVTFAGGLDRPHGLAFRGRDLYIAETARLLVARDEDGDLRADSVRVVSTDLPAGRGHWTRTVALGPDGHLYVSTGSSCNACVEEDPRRAAVLRFPPAGGPATLFARGLRNSVGLAFHPRTGELWGSDNGRDLLGDELPPEEINRIVEGGDYGWPYCYGRQVPDPEFDDAGRCRQTLPSEVEMQAHSAPLGIAFGEGLAFPEPYRDMLYVAFHGSWNRTVPTGYKLVGIPFRAGRPAGPPVDIVSGWLEGASAWGRPVAPAVGADGALYLSDDRAGAVYRIDFDRKREGS
jgi:glucose/arabinose dehydrogenase